MRRFNCTLADKRGEFGECMEAHNTGRYVLFSDVEKLQRRMQEMLDKSNSTGVAIERAISTGAVPADHPLKSRLELLANHHKRELALADGMVAMADRCKLLADLLLEVTRVVPAIGVAIDDLPVVDAFLERIEAALAGKIPAPSVTVTETIRTAPERIWLQVGDQSHYHSEPFPSDTSEVSWCADSVVACEVPYVRADLADKVPEQHKTNWPDKCPITRRDFFMEIDGVPTYGGPYDSYTIPEMLGTPEQPWHERELFVRRFDHDEGRWVDDEVISQRVIHDGVLDELLDLKEQQADQSGVAPQGGEQLNKNPAATAGQPAPTLNKQPSLTGQVLAGMGAATLLAGLDKESASDVVQLMLEAAEAKGGEPCDSASPSSSPD